MERCVHSHVYTFLQRNDILTPAQSGFIPGDSTSCQLASIYDEFCLNYDMGITTQAVFCDVSKAFEKVWHKGLLYKLELVGIRGQLLKWFHDYLTNRHQAVVIKGAKSALKCIPAGVPQGSVLGPLLFLIYINDIVNDTESVIKLFADDTSMSMSLEDPTRRAQILNADLYKINTWAKQWKVKFNEAKTELLDIKRDNIPTEPIIFNNIVLENVNQHKHLGVILQNDCKWDFQVRSIIKKVTLLINCLRYYKYRLNRKSLETMYKSFVLPHFDYADIIWDNCTEYWSTALEKLHLEAIRTIIGGVRGTSHDKLYKESGFCNLKERRSRHKLIILQDGIWQMPSLLIRSLATFNF
eukprot:GHVL01011503.1.p1 GENE.GHVL01011503.1~~GHVL01011503.1.p1  ORF type:complete len:354 (+),score=16.94 GHVL01011503.1:1058-2119(+)